jgi:AcrR family transcriptional regulator
MNLTQKYISDTFWALLEEMPYSKITVTTLVDRCHINRNTFYYHFHSIPDLLNYSIHEWAETILNENFDPEEPLNTIDPVIDAILDRKKAILRIYKSAQREVFIEQVQKNMDYIHDLYFQKVYESVAVDQKTAHMLTWVYHTFATGFLIDWLDHNMDYDLSERVHDYNGFLYKISGKTFSERLAAISNPAPAEACQ